MCANGEQRKETLSGRGSLYVLGFPKSVCDEVNGKGGREMELEGNETLC